MIIKLFGRGKEEREREAQFGRDITLAHAQGRAARGMTIADQQQLKSLGTAYFLQQDENVVSLLNDYFPELIPAFSRLNATSCLSKPKDLLRLELDFENLLLECEMELNEDDADYLGCLALLQSLGLFAKFRLHDAVGGYRGKLVTEEIERTTVQVEQPKQKKLL